MTRDWQVEGTNDAAPFTLKMHRGEGMVLLAMNWRNGEPPLDFVGFAIAYRPPGATEFKPVRNRIAFPGRSKPTQPGAPAEQYPSDEAPLQMFRWIHFPWVTADNRPFTYRVTPMFMDAQGVLRAGPAQEEQIVLHAQTIPGKLNVAFTRGYVSSQAFVDKYGGAAAFPTLIPGSADEGNDFKPTHPKAKDAYAWMGFEARACILDLLKRAARDKAEVMVVAYELNLPEMIDLLAKIGPRLRIILDNSKSTSKRKDGTVIVKDKGAPHSAESRAAAVLKAAGAQVVRQCMAGLQHNKMIVVDGPTEKHVNFGSTNFSWRGFYVQSNNAVIVSGAEIVAQQRDAFESYWKGNAKSFAGSDAAGWRPLHVDDLEARVSMSPHDKPRSTQKSIAEEIDAAKSSVFYSLAFLYQTGGDVSEAVKAANARNDLFVYGMSDKKTGFQLIEPGGNPVPVSPESLTEGLPEPFVSEASGGSGVKMHHKFVVIDFDKPNATVYTGSYNFSDSADTKNGENLLVIRSQRVATSYMVEALRIFDAYQYRLSAAKAKKRGDRKELQIPPNHGEAPWWQKFYTVPVKIRDRTLFA